jgi:hypothetical protein
MMARNYRRFPIATVLAMAMLVIVTVTAHADFRHSRPGPRPRAMGSAFVGVVDDANAVYWNPAGMTQMQKFEITGARTRLYAVDDLSNDYVAMAYNFKNVVSFGLSWVRLSLEDIYNEDTINLATAVDVPGVDNLSVGASLKLFVLDAPGYEQYNDPSYEGRQTKPSVDIGIHYHPDKNWAVGAVAYNLNEPELSLLSTTSDPDAVTRQYAVGASYVFRELVRTSFDIRTRHGSFDDTIGQLGSEVWFFDAVALRGGFKQEYLTAGMALKGQRWQLDAMLESHHELGNSYQLAATIKL